MYYIDMCERNNLTRRQLQERIKSKEYDRLNSETKNKLITKEQLKVNDLVPNPVIIKSDLLKEEISEYS
jgi:predicted nuclease of restriction endonuclease-like (RecB) superfamily